MQICLQSPKTDTGISLQTKEQASLTLVIWFGFSKVRCFFLLAIIQTPSLCHHVDIDVQGTGTKVQML